MKKISVFLYLVLCVFLLSACSKNVDADVLIREAKSNSENIKNCTADITNTLEFTANRKKYTYKSSTENVYFAEPFSLKSTQSTQLGSKANKFVTYTITDKNGVWFYTHTGDGWQKTPAGTVSQSPDDQIDVLRMINNVTSQKYVRETETNSVKADKIELTFKSNILQSTIETIVTASGMGNGSNTIVQALINSAPDIYGYCYIDKQSHNIIRIELNVEDALNKIFKNIEGNKIEINVSQCEIAGNVKDIGKAPTVELPPEAAAAQTVKAAG